MGENNFICRGGKYTVREIKSDKNYPYKVLHVNMIVEEYKFFSDAYSKLLSLITKTTRITFED